MTAMVDETVRKGRILQEAGGRSALPDLAGEAAGAGRICADPVYRRQIESRRSGISRSTRSELRFELFREYRVACGGGNSSSSSSSRFRRYRLGNWRGPVSTSMSQQMPCRYSVSVSMNDCRAYSRNALPLRTFCDRRRACFRRQLGSSTSPCTSALSSSRSTRIYRVSTSSLQ